MAARLRAILSAHPTMPAATASIERVALRHLNPDAQGIPEHSRRMTDGELLEQVRAGDPAAFGELVERHRGAVYRAALAALGNDADAEDIAQEALVLAYKRLDQFRGDASVRTWMVVDRLAPGAEPAAAIVVEREQDGGTGNRASGIARRDTVARGPRAVRTIHQDGAAGRFAGFRRNCATRCC